MSVSESLGERKTVELPQGTIAYRERGSGPPVVFVHGILVNGDLWRDVVPKISETHRCITPDWPLGAHDVPLKADADLSPPGLAKLIDDFLAALDLDDVTIVANDTGGALTQIMLANHPQRVGRVVLTSCDAFDNFLPQLFKGLQLLARVPGATLAIAHSLRPRPLQRLPIAFGWVTKRPVPPDIAESYMKPLRSDAGIRRDTGSVLKQIKSSYTLEAAAKLPDFDKPVLIAWASEDKIFPLEHGERLAKIFPDAKLVEIADSYTFIPEDQPERLTDLVSQWLAEREPAPKGAASEGGDSKPAKKPAPSKA